jgi:hypothetical protein
MAGFEPKRPNSTPADAPVCDPQLPLRALQYRMDNQLMAANSFGRYNVTVWRLDNHGTAEYVAAHNETISEVEKRHRPNPDNPAKVGLHSEVFVSQELYRRRDVLSGETRVTQIFTERIPCSECRTLLSGIPQFRDVPRYYYLAYHDQKWQREQGGGKWAVFLMNCYRLRPAE